MSIRERDAARPFIKSRTQPELETGFRVARRDIHALLQAGDALVEAVEWLHAIHKDKRIGEGCSACAAAARWREVTNG